MYFQPDDNHETRITERKKFKKYRFKHDLKMTFIFIFLYFLYLATSREDITEAHTILAYCFTDLLFSREYSSINRCLNTKWLTVASFNLAHFPKPKLSVKLNRICWWWHHTHHLNKKIFPIFENLLRPWNQGCFQNVSEFPFHIYSTHCYNLHTKNSKKILTLTKLWR